MTRETRHVGYSDSVSVLEWLLAGCGDDAPQEMWSNHAQRYAPVATGASFDAVIMPGLLGREVHHRLEVCLRCDCPAALVDEDVVLLVRARSGFSGPTVPACLDLRGAGAATLLPHPDDLTSWIRRPLKTQAPGFLPIPGIVHDVLYDHYYTHIPGLPPPSNHGGRAWQLVYRTEYREAIP